MNQNILQQEGMAKNLKSQPIIERWELRNFQSIQEFETLDLKPLTIFSGPNSSGKSAIIRSLLMVAQSLGSVAREVPLVLNGKYTKLGDFDHILHHGSDPAEIELSFMIKRQEDIEVWVKIEKDPDSLTSMRVVEQTIKAWEGEDSESCKEYFELNHSPVTLQEDEKQKASQILQEQIDQGLFDYEIIKPTGTGIESHPQYKKTVSASLSNFLPGRKLIRVESRIRNITEEFEQAREGIISIVMSPSIPIDWSRELSEETINLFGSIHMPRKGDASDTDDYIRIVEFIVAQKDLGQLVSLKSTLKESYRNGGFRI